jgi:hypothetical protein
VIEIRLLSTGEVLDLDDGAELRVSKALDRVDEVGQITQEAALSLSLPPTPHNRRLLSAADANVTGSTTSAFPVLVACKGQWLDITEIDLVDFSERDGYEAEPYAEDWQEGLDAMALSAIDVGSIEWTYPAVSAAWAAPIGQRTVLPFLADFGGEWYRQGVDGQDGVDLRDLRIVVSVYHVLRLALQRLDWNFVSPHLLNGDGRHWHCYLSGERWHTYPEKYTPWIVELWMVGRSFTIEGLTLRTDESARWGDITYQTTSGRDRRDVTLGPFYRYRYGGNHRPNEFPYMQVEFDYDVSVANPAPGGARALRFWVAVHREGGRDLRRGELLAEHRITVVHIPGRLEQRIQGTATLEVEPPTTLAPAEGEADPEKEVGYSINVVDDPAGAASAAPNRDRKSVYAHSLDVVFRPDPEYFSPGDRVRPRLTDEVSALELLQGIAHLCNAKVTTHLASRTVTLDVPFAYESQVGPDQFIDVPGFYRRTGQPLDMRQRTVPGSFRWRSDRQGTADRYLLYDYVSDNDEAVSEDQRRQWQRRVDTGARGSEERDRRNPLFEPTAIGRTRRLDTGGVGIDVPRIWTGEGDAERSRAVEPRVLNYWGRVAGPQADAWNFEGAGEPDYPYFSMAAAGAPYAADQTFAAPGPLVWRGHPGRDLYSRHYAGEVLDWEARSVEVQLLGGDQTYDAIDFRTPLLIATQEGDLLIQPTAVRDHARGSATPLQVEGYVIRY